MGFRESSVRGKADDSCDRNQPGSNSNTTTPRSSELQTHGTAQGKNCGETRSSRA
eukprot:CAMPEP_0171113746 /NCGR_PEP_ID=MMETSP0766_2-20121228/83431_1 /TAXON_ID=439317 /ORGANISM="Gambierdiscus australes, Strain CAWD 149" /LENGTH=54 /DNA_ID=CAMNT_0011575991 /DNA_START=944 /DNA_END=1105 /DNA_ORIENTATION=+